MAASGAAAMPARNSLLCMRETILRSGRFVLAVARSRSKASAGPLRRQHANRAVALVQQEHLIVWPEAKTQIGPRRRRLALRLVLLLNHRQHRLCRTVGVQQDASNRILSTRRQFVGVDVEDFAAR